MASERSLASERIKALIRTPPSHQTVIRSSLHVAQRNCLGVTMHKILYIVNVDGSNERRLTSGSNASWSPDGERVVFLSDAQYPSFPTVEVINADGSGRRTVATGYIDRETPVWRPTANEIIFHGSNVSADGGGTVDERLGLWLVRPDASFDPILLHEYGVGDCRNWESFDWSPDGTSVLGICRTMPEPIFPSRDIFRFTLANESLVNLTRTFSTRIPDGGIDAHDETDSVLSPDGRSMLFVGQLNGGAYNDPAGGIIRAGPTAENQIVLASRGTTGASGPSWQPCIAGITTSCRTLPRTDCEDGVNNDFDAFTDYRSDALSDPGCDESRDESEFGSNQCDNGKDDDSDGEFDANDIDCEGQPYGLSESVTTPPPLTDCEDGVNNDFDALWDYRSDALADPGCVSSRDESELGSNRCDNGVDDDLDGKVDAEDIDCGGVNPTA